MIRAPGRSAGSAKAKSAIRLNVDRWVNSTPLGRELVPLVYTIWVTSSGPAAGRETSAACSCRSPVNVPSGRSATASPAAGGRASAAAIRSRFASSASTMRGSESSTR
jgi:hypothetical protein